MSKHGNIGNKHAVKPDNQKATAQLQGRCKPSDKERWVRQAQSEGLKLMPWIIKQLNEAVENAQDIRDIEAALNDGDEIISSEEAEKLL